MTVPAAAVEHHRRMAGLAEQVARAALAAWAAVEAGAVVASWARLIAGDVWPPLVAAQLAAAAAAEPYVRDIAPDSGRARLVPGGFAGVASDGRPLASLLMMPAIATLAGLRSGATPERALAAGATSLDMIVRTQVADAGRAAVGVAIAARPRVGYARMLNPPSCSRCIVLAGRVYRWNQGFNRHPRCDCTHIPVQEDAPGDVRTDPDAYFRSLPAAEQDRVFGKAGARAIRDGADLGQVVNARRGAHDLQVAGRTVKATREGTTTLRLMPEQIYAEAGDDRAEAVRLLRRNGYLR